MSFDKLGLDPPILQAISDAGYEHPTPIQAQAIPLILAGQDVLGLAQTGTGKTAGFTLPMINRLAHGRARARMPRTLILEPTRELAAQVAESFTTYGKNSKLSMALLIGGVAFGEQERALERGVDVLIATPGRLLDHCQRGKILLRGVEMLVIDEADRMLDMGFIPDIERIVKLIPFTRQTLLFSATMPKEIESLAAQFLQAPARVEVSPPSSTVEKLEQKILWTDAKNKQDILYSLLKEENIGNGIIFCNRKRDISGLAHFLRKKGISLTSLHGDMNQHIRMQMLEKFRNGECKFLIASDVAARGLDIPDVTHVFNFDVPINSEDYVHRIGRTARAGRSGHAYMLASNHEGKYVEAIEAMLGTSIPSEKADRQKQRTSKKQADKNIKEPRRRLPKSLQKRKQEKGERRDSFDEKSTPSFLQRK
ncbi:MAG: DEAD/DEAH box helicase [Parvibaculales bacterium]